MKLVLNESQEDLRNDRKEKGLAEDSAPREDIYGIELPILIVDILIDYWKKYNF